MKQPLREAVRREGPVVAGTSGVFDSSGNIRRWNSNFLGYSAADIMRTGIIGTVAPESL
jgi:hypothetical protein